VDTPTSPGRVLILDDELSVLGFLDTYFQMLDFEPLPTSRWTEAVDLILHRTPDLILLDLRMPTIQGEAVLKFIRERDRRLPVIVISGYLDAQKVRDLRRMGVSGFVPKPFELDELDAAVHRALEMRGPPEPGPRPGAKAEAHPARPAISSGAAALGAIPDRALPHHRQRRPRRSRDLKTYVAVAFFCLIGSLIVVFF
jgi:DNA-binding NtrC family response regulator